MLFKFIIFLIFIGLARQGLAVPLLDKTGEEQTGTAQVQKKDFESKKEAFVKLMVEMSNEAEKYLEAYQRCDDIEDPNALIICREAIQAEFCDSLKKQIAESGSTLCL